MNSLEAKRSNHATEQETQRGVQSPDRIEAMRGVETVTEIARKNGLNPVQGSAWKKQLEDNFHVLFERKGTVDDRIASWKPDATGLSARSGNWSSGRRFSKKVRGEGDRTMRKSMVETDHPSLLIRR